jgi:hypothetical protein
MLKQRHRLVRVTAANQKRLIEAEHQLLVTIATPPKC